MSKKKEYQDSVVTATDTLEYQCSIEGYSMDGDSMPRMTDFKAHYKAKYTQTNTVITQPIIKPQKRNKWVVTFGVGSGIGLFNRQPDIYVGFNIGYSL